MANPKQANEIFGVFLIVFQLHQILWYLIEALSVVLDEYLTSSIEALILENVQMTDQSPNEILKLDVEKYRLNVNQILKKVSESIIIYPTSNGKNKNFLGKNFKKATQLYKRKFQYKYSSEPIASNLLVS